jgi:alpha-aminoadipate carrier protein LysW
VVNCPECDAQIDIEEDDVDEGDLLSCDECGAELRVVSTEPLELESIEEDEEEEDEDGFFDEDEEEDEESDDEWK